MNGRTYVVIFFFWALLTIITPILINLSESAKHESESTLYAGDNNGKMMNSRKLVGHLIEQEIILSQSPSPSPAPEPALEELEAAADMLDGHGFNNESTRRR